MKRSNLFFIGLCAILLCSCKKTENMNGVILITVMNENKHIPNANVYVKTGVNTDPGVPLTEYDMNLSTDNSGQVTIGDLPTNSYFFYATADLPTGTVSGTVSVKVESRIKNSKYDKGPRYEKIIDTK